MTEEERYIKKRIWISWLQSILFYLCRLLPINGKKIVFCTIEGTTGYTCNPKYIAEELIRWNKTIDVSQRLELIWLVNDKTKRFPNEIKVVHNSLWNRAYQLSTARIWIDNSRKQLEVRKRKGQLYIQTWHAKLGFKPTCLDRGGSFSRIAFLVSKHDSDMIDYVLSNSKWYDDTLPNGMIYEGPTLRTGSPRCDILVKAGESAIFKEIIKEKMRQQLNIHTDAIKCSDLHFMMYAPTFRGGSQGAERSIAASQGFPDFRCLKNSLEKKFGGCWYICIRLHPQLVARDISAEIATAEGVVDVSRVDDMYEVLAGCDAFMTDYSSAAFDAAVMRIPVFLYADDYKEYEGERGKLLWDLRKLPFPLSLDNKELEEQIHRFDIIHYQEHLDQIFLDADVKEDGKAAAHVATFLLDLLKQDSNII